MAEPDDDDKLAEEWGLNLDGEGGDDAAMAAEWAAMIEGDGSDDDGGGADRVLNQDEIDNLLGFDPNAGGEVELTGVQALINSALVSYERLPMLEIVFDRLVRLSTTSLRNFTSDNVEVSLDSITSVRFGDYLNSIPLPAILSVIRAEEWENFGLLTVDSSLIYAMIDVLLGGRRAGGVIRVEGRPYTTIEMALARRMIEVILEDTHRAFEPLTQVNFSLERLETNPRFAAISRPANAAILIDLRIDMDDRGGKIEILLPYATIEPIREQLLQMFMGEKFGRDPIWEGHLATENLLRRHGGRGRAARNGGSALRRDEPQRWSDDHVRSHSVRPGQAAGRHHQSDRGRHGAYRQKCIGARLAPAQPAARHDGSLRRARRKCGEVQMMGLPLGLIVEGLVCVLLMLTIGYAIILNERLKRLHADRDALKDTVADLVRATDQANKAISELKQTATEADLTLGARLEEADHFAVELANHVTAGQGVIERIAKILKVAREREAPHNMAPPPPANRAQEALRRLRSHQIGQG